MNSRSRNAIWAKLDDLWLLFQRLTSSVTQADELIISIAAVLENHVQVDTGTGSGPASTTVSYPAAPGLAITTSPVNPESTPPGNFLVSACANVIATPADALTAQLQNESGAIGPLLKATADANGFANFSITWEDTVRGAGAHHYYLLVTDTTGNNVAVTASGAASLVVQETF